MKLEKTFLQNTNLLYTVVCNTSVSPRPWLNFFKTPFLLYVQSGLIAKTLHFTNRVYLYINYDF